MNVRVMVVDESSARADLLQRALYDAGYRIVACIAPDEHMPSRVCAM